jgi:hypothetical protein
MYGSNVGPVATVDIKGRYGQGAGKQVIGHRVPSAKKDVQQFAPAFNLQTMSIP